MCDDALSARRYIFYKLHHSTCQYHSRFPLPAIRGTPRVPPSASPRKSAYRRGWSATREGSVQTEPPSRQASSSRASPGSSAAQVWWVTVSGRPNSVPRRPARRNKKPCRCKHNPPTPMPHCHTLLLGSGRNSKTCYGAQQKNGKYSWPDGV